MRNRILVYDAALVLWTAAWLVVGLLVYRDVRDLAELSEPALDAAVALEETADGLREIRTVPFLGDVGNLEQIERRVRVAARSTRRSAHESREGIRRLAWLLAGSIALVPTLPLLALYVPVRRDWRRRR